MTNLALFLLFCIASIFAWASIGCCVLTVRTRYYPLLFLSVFSLLIGWLIASLQWMPAVPVGLGSAAMISLALYRWFDKRYQRPDVRAIGLRHVLCWWVHPDPVQGSNSQR